MLVFYSVVYQSLWKQDRQAQVLVVNLQVRVHLSNLHHHRHRSHLQVTRDLAHHQARQSQQQVVHPATHLLRSGRHTIHRTVVAL